MNEIYKYLQQGDYNTADKITRAKARQYYLKYIAHIDYGEKLRIIDEITGGLGYKGGELNILEMNFAGVIISWIEVVKSKSKVLEIGTGLGRTCFIVVKNTSPSLYLSLDKSLTMLAIALFSNPIKEYMQALNSNVVKVAWADALKAVDMIPDVFDHIIHDGGPNPNKNPRLYSESFLAKLARLLKNGGTISVFAGMHRVWQERIYVTLSKVGIRVEEAVHLPHSKALVYHGVKE